MADKTLGINVEMDISDVTDELNNLIDLFGEIPDNITTEVDITGDADTELNNITDETNTLNDTTLAIPVDTSGITDVDSDTNTLYDDLMNLGSAADQSSSEIQSAMNDADDSVNTLDGDVTNLSGDLRRYRNISR